MDKPAPTDISTADYWSARYRAGQTGWDTRGVNRGLVDLVLAHSSPRDRVLIPGAGSGYEAEELLRRGYREVYVCDWAAEAFAGMRASPVLAEAFPDPAERARHFLVGDFFGLEGSYDVLVEQTFFCAIDPARRGDYVAQAARLLRPGGLVVGLLFDRAFPAPGPPFGGDRDAYAARFATHFEIERLGAFAHSIPSRQGTELALVARRKAEL